MERLIYFHFILEGMNGLMFKKLKNKKIYIGITIIFIAILIFLVFFVKNNYKIFEVGNNMSNKSIEEIEEYILNISSYEAEIEVTVESNKNTNKYLISQQYINPNQYKQTILEPSNIEGIEISYDGQNLTISNSKLNLNKIYENYEYIASNILTLEAFISDYKDGKEENNTNYYEEDNEYVFEVKVKSDNKYTQNKILYVDKDTGKPTKMLVQDINEKNVVYILYNEIKINDLDQNNILAKTMKEFFVRRY